MKTQSTFPVRLHQQRMMQLKTQPTISVRLLSVIIGVIVVIMTIIFLAVPYALSSHPGDASPTTVITESSQYK